MSRLPWEKEEPKMGWLASLGIMAIQAMMLIGGLSFIGIGLGVAIEMACRCK